MDPDRSPAEQKSCLEHQLWGAPESGGHQRDWGAWRVSAVQVGPTWWGGFWVPGHAMGESPGWDVVSNLREVDDWYISVAFQYLKEGYKQELNLLFVWVVEQGRISFKLKGGRFRLDVREVFHWVVRCLNRSPRKVMDAPSLDVFKAQLDGQPDRVLDLAVGNLACGRGVGIWWSLSFFPMQTFLWFITDLLTDQMQDFNIWNK